MKTDWKDDIFTQRKIRLTENSDGTVTPVDATTYTQKGDSFGAKELNAIGTEINEVKKSVSDGKAEIAAAITLKRVTTAASATFHQMAENIKKIVLGSGNAQPADVRKGKTFTNDEGIEKAGTMPEYISGTKGISCGLNDSGLYYYMGAGYWIQDGSGKSWVYMSRDDVAATIGLNPDAMLDSINVLGKQGKIQSMAGATITPQTYAQTVWSAWKRLTGNVDIAAVPLPPANVIKKGYRYWIGGSYVDGTYVYSDITGYYYQAPNEMLGVTGGWNWILPTDQKPNPGTLSRQQSYMEIKMNPGSWSGGSSSGSNNVAAFLCTAYKLNLTNVRTIYLPFIDGSYGNYPTYFGIANEVPYNATWNNFVFNVSAHADSNTQLVLDVSNITGSYYLVMKVSAYYGSTSGIKSNNTRFSEIRYETMER